MNNLPCPVATAELAHNSQPDAEGLDLWEVKKLMATDAIAEDAFVTATLLAKDDAALEVFGVFVEMYNDRATLTPKDLASNHNHACALMKALEDAYARALSDSQARVYAEQMNLELTGR